MSIFVIVVNFRQDERICKIGDPKKYAHVAYVWIKLDKARFINCLCNSRSGRLECRSLIAPFASALKRHCFLYQAPTANSIDREWEHRQLAAIVSIGVNMIIVRLAIPLLCGRICHGFYWTISCFDASAREMKVKLISRKIKQNIYITLLYKRQMAV